MQNNRTLGLNFVRYESPSLNKFWASTYPKSPENNWDRPPSPPRPGSRPAPPGFAPPRARSRRAAHLHHGLPVSPAPTPGSRRASGTSLPCLWTVMLEKTLESPLDTKEIQPVYPKGTQSWIFIGGLMLKLKLQYFCHLMGGTDLFEKTDAAKDWRQEQKGWQRMR